MYIVTIIVPIICIRYSVSKDEKLGKIVWADFLSFFESRKNEEEQTICLNQFSEQTSSAAMTCL